MIKRLWVYNFDTCSVDWAYAYPASINDSWYVCRTDGDGTQTRETIGYGVFLTEKDATKGLLKSLIATKNKIQSEIEQVQQRLEKFE